MNLRLVPVSHDNLPDLAELELRPGQERFVAPVLYSLAEAYLTPTAWPRAIVDGDEVIGFLMVNFDSNEQLPADRCFIWRMNVAAHAQGRGVGRFAIEQIAAAARERGLQQMTVSWEPGADGPEGFYLRCGFEPTGEIMDGEVVAVRGTEPQTATGRPAPHPG